MVCGDKFEVVWESIMNEWMIKNSILLKVTNIEKSKQKAIEAEAVDDKIAVHYDCYNAFCQQDTADQKGSEYNNTDYNNLSRTAADVHSSGLKADTSPP